MIVWKVWERVSWHRHVYLCLCTTTGICHGNSSISLLWTPLFVKWPNKQKVFKSKVKSNYFIVRPKVDQWTGLLSLPHLGNFRRTHAYHICFYFVSIHQRATTGAQRCALLVRLLTTNWMNRLSLKRTAARSKIRAIAGCRFWHLLGNIIT